MDGKTPYLHSENFVERLARVSCVLSLAFDKF